MIDQYVKLKRSCVQIAKDFNCSKETVRKILKDNGIQLAFGRHGTKYKCENSTFFEKIDCEEKAYWLGFMYADGFIQKSDWNPEMLSMGLSLKTDDISHLEKLKTALGYNGNINTYVSSSGFSQGRFPYSRLLIRDDTLTKDLIKQGCVQNKTFVLEFPSIEIVPADLQKHFIRGYFDGDGSLTKECTKEDYFKITLSFTGTKRMLQGIQKVFNKENVKLIQRHPERNNNNYTLNICGNPQCLKYLDFMYENAIVYLDRKYNRYLEYKQIVNNNSRAS